MRGNDSPHPRLVFLAKNPYWKKIFSNQTGRKPLVFFYPLSIDHPKKWFFSAQMFRERKTLKSSLKTGLGGLRNP
jgi:hypothetical protein